MNRYQFFTPAELVCPCGDCGMGEWDMNPRFMHRVVDLRRLLDPIKFIVTSAIRCPAYNATVSSTGISGPHTTGHAIDLAIYGYHAARLEEHARKHGITGIGMHQVGPRKGRFMHLDDLPDAPGQPRPWPWTY